MTREFAKGIAVNRRMFRMLMRENEAGATYYINDFLRREKIKSLTSTDFMDDAFSHGEARAARAEFRKHENLGERLSGE